MLAFNIEFLFMIFKVSDPCRLVYDFYCDSQIFSSDFLDMIYIAAVARKACGVSYDMKIL